VAYRTTPAAVKAVLARDYDSVDEPSLTPYLDAASLLVGDLEDAASTAPAAARLELVERWLAAHYYALSDQPYSDEWTEGAKATYQGKTGMYFEATKYGQAALGLDTTGYLAGLQAAAVVASGGSSRVTAGVSWLGKAPSAQRDYNQRD
jgi:hypothetical protein